MVIPSGRVPFTQGLNSSTFKQPPLDGSLTLHEIYEWHAVQSPDHPLFIYEDGPGCTRAIVWREAVKGIHRATRFIRKAVGPELDHKKDGKALVVSILAALGEHLSTEPIAAHLDPLLQIASPIFASLSHRFGQAARYFLYRLETAQAQSVISFWRLDQGICLSLLTWPIKILHQRRYGWLTPVLM